MEKTYKQPIPQGWTESDVPLDPATTLNLTFALKVRQAKEIENLFWRVSDPDSPDYTKYVDLNYFIENYSTDKKTINLLLEWLGNFDLKNIFLNPTKDFLTVEIPVSQAEEIFQVKFKKFQNENYGTIIRTLDPYSLPNQIANEVVFVTGMNRFPPKRPLKAIHTKRSLQQDAINPQVIWKSFNTQGAIGKSPKNLQAVAQFLEQYYDPTDLQDFQNHFQIPLQPVDKLIGPNDPSNPGTEALLDIEYIIATAPKIPTWFWSTEGLYNGQEPFVQWAINVNAATTVPLVISVSYGDEESSVSKDYTDRLNLELQKMALRGISVLFASGDNGVGCTSACIQDPNWPASSPYVTTVGGFYGSSNSLVGDTISSGGFSNYYPMPTYQLTVVPNYLTKTPNLPPATIYNKTSRAMPDISSYSENVQIYEDGREGGVAGTSCAAPVFAGIISLINDNLLLDNKEPLGFLNQALYRIGQTTPNAFLDVTTGSNANGCCAGFPAAGGWDPITGWGGPNYPVLMTALSSLQRSK